MVRGDIGWTWKMQNLNLVYSCKSSLAGAVNVKGRQEISYGFLFDPNIAIVAFLSFEQIDQFCNAEAANAF